MNIVKFVGAICIVMLMAAYANAQSDPGVSRHNYKHPNKAKIARENSNDGIQLQVSNFQSARRFETLKHQSKINSFPKYAPKRALVALPLPSVENYNNSLRNPANYKTQQQNSKQNLFSASL